jgi:hypothetical protein
MTQPASYDGFYPLTKTATIENGQTATLNFDLETLPQPAIFKGDIKNSDGDGIPNAQISLEKDGDIITQHSDDAGYYSFSIPKGDYTITITKEGYTTHQDSVSLSAGSTTERDYILNAPMDFNMLFLTAFVIAIGVVLLLSCMTMNIVVLFIGFAGSALAWILYNTSIGGLF